MATYGNGLKYSAAATSGGVVPANSFAIVTYTCTATTAPGSTSLAYGVSSVVTRMYPAGATVLATFTAVSGSSTTAYTGTWTFQSGVILTNS